MTERDIETILGLAANRLNPTRTAKALFMNRGTVIYHIEKIKRITGLDATDFYDLCILLHMVNERRTT